MVENNRSRDNGGHGIALTLGDGNRKNRFIRNTTAENDKDGIFRESLPQFDARSLGTLVERNVAHNNDDDGLDVDEPDTTITRNTANNNDDLGIEAVDGVTDGGGNRGRGNGDNRQCTGVQCR
jgi:hypothetical protein